MGFIEDALPCVFCGTLASVLERGGGLIKGERCYGNGCGKVNHA